MTVVDELFYKIGFKVDDKQLSKLESSFKQISKAAVAMSKAAVVAGGAVFAFTNKIASNLDSLDETATSLGITTTELQKLQFVANRVGVGIEGMNMGLKFMNKHLAEAMDSGSSDSLDKLGLSVEQLKGLAPEQQLKIIADRFQYIEDNAQKTAIAMDIFGRSGGQMVNMLKDGSGAIDNIAAKMPFIADQDTINRASQFKDSMQEFFALMNSVATMMAAELFPVIKDITQQIADWVIKNKDLIRSGLRTFLTGVYFVLRVLATVIEMILRVLTNLETIFRAISPYLRFIASGLIAVAVWKIVAALRAAFVVIRGITILSLIGWLRTAAMAAATFWTALTGPVALAIAAIAAVALVIDDLWAWFEGRDSITGMLLGPFDEWFERFKGGLAALKETITGFFNEIKTDPVWRALAGGIAGMAVGGPVGAAIGAVAGFATGDQNKMVTNNTNNTVTNNMSVSGVNDPHAAAAILEAHQRRQSNVATQNSNKDSR